LILKGDTLTTIPATADQAFVGVVMETGAPIVYVEAKKMHHIASGQ